MNNNIVDGEIVSNPAGLSPTPTSLTTEPNSMSFPEAIARVIDGAMITKLEWADTSSYGILLDGRLKIVLKGKAFDWILSDGDLNGLDYIIREEPN